jgi:hypothetical protein
MQIGAGYTALLEPQGEGVFVGRRFQMDQVPVGAGMNPTVGSSFKKGGPLIDLLHYQSGKHGLRPSHFHLIMIFFGCA